MKFVNFLILIMIFLSLSSVVFATNCETVQLVDECIANSDCTMNDDVSLCINYVDDHEVSDYCGSLDFDECLAAAGCILSGDATTCFVANEDEIHVFEEHDPIGFRLDDNYFTFTINYICDNIYIDGVNIDNFEISYAGGPARSYYEVLCVEGDILEAESNGEIVWSYDISDYECVEEGITYDYIHLHPNIDNLVLTDSALKVYSNIKLRNTGSNTIENVKVEMSIPKLNLNEIQIISELRPNYGTSTPKQFMMDIPSNIESGNYIVNFYVNDELVKTFKRGFYREDEVKCVKTDEIDYYHKSKISLILDNGDVIRSQNDDCCVHCMTAPSDYGPYLSEYYCDNNKIEREIYECHFGCKNGRCIGTVQPIEEAEPVTIPKPNVVEKVVFECGACELSNICYPVGFRKDTEYCSGNEFAQQKEDKETCNNPYECKVNICEKNACGNYCDGCKDDGKNCIPFGTRIDDKYCSLDKTFENQNINNELCNNNYECVSNICINSECIESNLLRKAINWFKTLFS